MIWVWSDLGGLATEESRIRAAVTKQQVSETYFYAEGDDGEKWQCGLVSELDIGRLQTAKLVDDFFLGRAIPVDGRTEAAVKKDLAYLLLWEKRIHRKA